MSISCDPVNKNAFLYDKIDNNDLKEFSFSVVGHKNFDLYFSDDAISEDNIYKYVISPADNSYVVSYSRTSGLTDDQIMLLTKHYDADLTINYNNQPVTVDVRKRITQHYYCMDVYIQEAKRMCRLLTEQEQDYLCSNTFNKKISVSHIIANVTIQCMFNHLTLQFLSGAETVSQHMHNLLRAQKNLRQSEVRLNKVLNSVSIEDVAVVEGKKVNQTNNINIRKASFAYHHDIFRDNYRFVMAGIAVQAAAIARMRGIGRAIIHEESLESGYGEVIHLEGSELAKLLSKRNKMAKDISIAFGDAGSSSFRMQSAKSQVRERSRSEGGTIGRHKPSQSNQTRTRASSFSAYGASEGENRLVAYLSYMRHIADSVGNLRLGDSVGNAQVGAGFDMPLTKDHKPTDRGQRLLHALHTYGLPHFVKPGRHGSGDATYTTGIFSKDSSGARLASSRQASSDSE